jgi:hypothetical protein
MYICFKGNIFSEIYSLFRCRQQGILICNPASHEAFQGVRESLSCTEKSLQYI